MTRKLIALSISMLLMVSMLPGIALGTGITLVLNANSAKVGDNITASGLADVDTWVSVKVLDSARNIVMFDAVKTDTHGNYSCTFIVPGVTAGTLAVIAGYGSNVAEQPLNITGSGAAAVTGVSLNKNSIIIVAGDSETLLAAVTPANAANKAVTWSSDKETVATVDAYGKVTAIAPGTATIMAMTADGNKTASCAVTVTRAETATSGGTVSITDTPVTIIVPPNVASSITVSENTALPLVEVKSNQVDMIIPAGTQVNASTIKLPEVKPSSSVNVAAAQQVDLVIKVGSDLGTITFSKPVRLVLKGQGSKSAGFIDNNGKFQAIAKLVSLNGLISDADVDAAGLALSNAGVQQGAVVSGNDLIVWTKHFTEFIAYTPIASGSSDGGGSSITSAGQTITSTGGTIKEAGAVVTFPADAVSSDIKVTVKKLTAGIPAVSSEFKLAGEVYEITSDQTSAFKKPVKITLPFERSKVDTDKYDVGIYCWNNNQWVILDEIKVDTGTVSGTVNHFSKFAVLACEKETQEVFKPIPAGLKDISGHWAETNISSLVAAEAVSGYPDGTFKPNNTITRAEFATILVKAFKLNLKEGKVFNDTADHWARESIATAAGHGIVNGYSDTAFGPDDNITREQMAVMIVKAAKLTNTAEGKIFADKARISDWAQEAVSGASGKGIISGYPDNTFRPKANATRAEAVSVIVKAL